jgi:hypothetical protein
MTRESDMLLRDSDARLSRDRRNLMLLRESDALLLVATRCS